MYFQSPLYRAFLTKRYSKVLADVRMENGMTETVFCPNTTRMLTLTDPRTEVYLSYRNKPYRRLQLVWEIASVNGVMVGINMDRQRDLIVEAVLNNTLYELGGYAKMEQSSDAHLELVLTPAGNSGYPVCKIAVSPAYLKKGTELFYPDGTDLSNHHMLRSLSDALQAGERAVLVVLAQRIDCMGIRANWTADTPYLLRLKELCDKGLEIICCGCNVSLQGIELTARLPFTF